MSTYKAFKIFEKLRFVIDSTINTLTKHTLYLFYYGLNKINDKYMGINDLQTDNALDKTQIKFLKDILYSYPDEIVTLLLNNVTMDNKKLFKYVLSWGDLAKEVVAYTQDKTDLKLERFISFWSYNGFIEDEAQWREGLSELGSTNSSPQRITQRDIKNMVNRVARCLPPK